MQIIIPSYTDVKQGLSKTVGCCQQGESNLDLLIANQLLCRLCQRLAVHGRDDTCLMVEVRVCDGRMQVFFDLLAYTWGWGEKSVCQGWRYGGYRRRIVWRCISMFILHKKVGNPVSI